jgi:hypothetical protein
MFLFVFLCFEGIAKERGGITSQTHLTSFSNQNVSKIKGIPSYDFALLGAVQKLGLGQVACGPLF